jgi:uncharacterized protein (TIGR03067 family)
MKPLALTVLSLSALLLAEPQTDAEFAQELAQFQGTWRPISMEMDGKLLPQEQIGKTRLTIQGEKFTFDTGQDSHEGLYKIDPSHDPKHLDIVITRGDEKGKTYLVAYKFEDGKMVQVMEVSNAKRPKEFSGKKGSGNLLEYWEKVQ